MKKTLHSRISLFWLVCFSFSLLWSTKTSASQVQTIFYGTNGKIVGEPAAIYKKELKFLNSRSTLIETFKIDNGKWHSVICEKFKAKTDTSVEVTIKSDEKKEKIVRSFRKTGDSLYFFTDYSNKKKIRDGYTSSKYPLKFDGIVNEYYSKGNLKSTSIYRNNELVSNKNWNENGEEYISDIFYSVDSQPTYKPGLQALHNHIRQIIKQSGIDITAVEGHLIVGFTVMENGKIDGIKIIHGLGRTLNNLVMQSFLTLDGDWSPAKLNYKNVRYFQVFPINFIYRKYDFDFLELKGPMLHYHII